MKTSHQFARELLEGADLPIFHFDPSCAGTDPDGDSSVSDPMVDLVEHPNGPFLTIFGPDTDEREARPESDKIVQKLCALHGCAPEFLEHWCEWTAIRAGANACPWPVFGAEYHHADGGCYSFHFQAQDRDDAERRLRAIRGNAELIGELKGTISASVPGAGFWVRFRCWLGNRLG